MRHFGFTIAALAALFTLFAAQPSMAEEQDQTYIFGTTLVLHSPRQLADPAKTWWGDLLPMEYRFSIGSIVQAINKARAARGEKQMVDVTTYPINVGGEFSTDAGWEYTIDFQKMLPADVEVALASFPLTGIFADLKQELRPVRIGYFWGNSMDGGPVTISLPGFDLVVNAEEAFGLLRQRLQELFRAEFGERVKFDIGVNRYSSALGNENFDVNLTIYLDGAEQYMNYGYDGYEHDH